MGLGWSLAAAKTIQPEIRSSKHMHAQHLAWARRDYWSLVTWYRGLNPDGTVQDSTPCQPPLCVVPHTNGTYHLITSQGVSQRILAQDEVAEFEDTLFCRHALSPAWQDALEPHMRGTRDMD